MANHKKSKKKTGGLRSKGYLVTPEQGRYWDRLVKATEAGNAADAFDPDPEDFEVVLDKIERFFVSGQCLFDVCKSHVQLGKLFTEHSTALEHCPGIMRLAVHKCGLYGKYLPLRKGHNAATVARFEKEREDCRSYIEEHGYQ